MTESLPGTAHVRISRFVFDVSRYEEIDAMNTKISSYLVPAVGALPGLIHFYAAVSPTGTAVHVSVWDTLEHAKQLDTLKEMVVIARGEAEAAGATFEPVVNYPVSWTI